MPRYTSGHQSSPMTMTLAAPPSMEAALEKNATSSAVIASAAVSVYFSNMSLLTLICAM